MTYVSARERALNLFDEFEEIASPDDGADAVIDPISFPCYPEDQKRVREQRAIQDADESVLTGIGSLNDLRCVAAIFDFGYFGGSMGVVAGRRLESAMHLALEMRIPFVALTTTGGARMQEGMAALAQMPRTVAASIDLAAAGIPRISVLGDPTTGGVYSSFAAISDVVLAEAEATIGFAGPRIAAQISGQGLPPGSHTAEMAFEAGLIDSVVESAELRSALSRLLRIIPIQESSETAPSPTPPISSPTALQDAWSQFELARHPDRPSPRFYIERLSPELFEMHGDRQGSDDGATIAALGSLGGRPVVFVAFDKRRPTAAGFRKAARAIRLAARLRFPIVSLIDTPGADPTFDSEYGGLAAAIGETFAASLGADVPFICAVVGEGGSGGALAIACGDVVGIQIHAVFSVIAPEGAAEILYRDSSRAKEIAPLLRPTSSDLLKLGIVDEVIPEPKGGAHTNPETAADMLKDWLMTHIDSEANTKNRRNRFRL